MPSDPKDSTPRYVFPNLIDIADRLCRGTFDPSGIAASVNAVFAAKGEPFRYLLERATRA
jgi:hypothetical protein